MTVKEFGKQFNLSEQDMLEVFIGMNAFSENLDDWLPKYYDEKIVSSLDNIIDVKRLARQVKRYHNELSKLFYSKITPNSSAKKIIQKANLNKNQVLRNFARTDI